MGYYCFFDRLPVELLHDLFKYFWTHEILFIFSDLSDHINAVLSAYNTYQFNFKSIHKDHFDLICKRIRPEQVISLVLSDENDTPAQSELFFSYFQIEQFTQLQALTLIKIEVESLKWIFPNLYKLNLLRSLTFLNLTIPRLYQNQMNDIQSLIYESFSKIMLRINRIHLTDGVYLSSISFPYLHYLKIEKCSINDLKTLFEHSTQLRSLSICLNMHFSTSNLISLPIQLIRLHLKIENRIISIDEMEYLLSNLPYLQHLQLELNGSEDLFNGNRWQILTQNLITFNFKFNGQYILNRNILESYSTSYWIEEKHWFVGYNEYSLFSIPYFAPNYIDMSQYLNCNSTASDLTLLYSRINTISLERNPFGLDYYFTHINTLKMRLPISFSFLTTIIDLNQIKCLSLSSLDDILKYVPLNEIMPQLRELCIHVAIDIDGINRMGNNQFKQIHKLEISIFGKYNEYITEKLIYLFPNVHHLICTPSYTNPEQIMHRCINGFKYLSNASFSLPILSNIKQDFEFIITQSRCITKDNFTCRRISHSPKSYSRFDVNWWFGKQSSSSSSFFIRYYPIQATYYWHLFRYHCLTFMDKLSTKYLLYISVCFYIMCMIGISVKKIFQSKNYDYCTICWSSIITLFCLFLSAIFWRDANYFPTLISTVIYLIFFLLSLTASKILIKKYFKI